MALLIVDPPPRVGVAELAVEYLWTSCLFWVRVWVGHRRNGLQHKIDIPDSWSGSICFWLFFQEHKWAF